MITRQTCVLLFNRKKNKNIRIYSSQHLIKKVSEGYIAVESSYSRSVLDKIKIMKTMVIILVFVATLFVYHASAVECSYYIQQACWYGNTESQVKQEKCEQDALPLCKKGKECEACKKACNEGDNYNACYILYCMDFFLCP